MTATIDDIRQAIADDLNDLQNLRANPYLTPQINPPQAMVDVEGPTQVTFSTAGAVEYTFTIAVFDQFSSEKASQKRFDELRDPWHARSIKRKLEDSTRLAALAGVDYGEVGPSSPAQPVQVGTVEYLRVTWPFPVVIRQES